MRKIEQQMCNAIALGKDWKSGNTRVVNVDGWSRVFLHDNLIAVVTEDDVRVFDGGWQSNTTKSRLNAIIEFFCDAGEGVFQRDFKWYIHKLVGIAGQSKVFNEIPFTNGYIFA